MDVRRRRSLLAGVALAATIAGAVAGAPGGSKPPSAPGRSAVTAAADAAAQRLPLDRAAGLLVIIRFRGTTAPVDVLRGALRDDRAAGVILFGDNIRSRAQSARVDGLAAALGARPRADRGRPRGGAIRRLPWAAPVESNRSRQRTGRSQPRRSTGARDLAAEGIDVVLGPVADVPDGPDSALAARGFSSDPDETASAVAAAVRAWLAGHVAPALKHFPGLGACGGGTLTASR